MPEEVHVIENTFGYVTVVKMPEFSKCVKVMHIYKSHRYLTYAEHKHHKFTIYVLQNNNLMKINSLHDTKLDSSAIKKQSPALR